jgi:threonyl-tRNA synthetase
VWENTAAKAAEEIQKVANDVKTKSIVLYPYVHLTSSPSSPKAAKRVLAETENLLKARGFGVGHAPFGYYKAFTLKAKGHPLSELSREFSGEPGGTSKTEDAVSGALKAEEMVRSEWFVLTPGGLLESPDKFNFAKHAKLEKFYKYEVAKVRSVPSEPPHSKLMRSLELVDYEQGSDPGNLKFYPKGRLIKSLLEEWVTSKVNAYGGMEVETPIMYDFGHPALKSYLNRFPARQYTIESAKRKFFLRFSACFGQFLEAAGASISYKNLPMRIYELTRYSFRLEKAGELVALRRLRAFTMPDMHTMCRNLEQAREEFLSQFRLCMECMHDIELSRDEYEMAFRCTRDFWEEHKGWVQALAKEYGRPMLVEMWNMRYAYFDPKFEFNFVDGMDKAGALATVQIDHENGERFGIQYTDDDNTRKHPFILHCSPSGAIERVLYALLEKAWLTQKAGGVPSLPVWLSPTQVRLCPINDTFIEDCKKLASELEARQIRADVDDRTESLQKKIRDAELEWVPYIVTFGEKEKQEGKYATRLRETGKVVKLSFEDIANSVREKTDGKPFKALSLPKLLSKRPIFVSRQ